MEHDDYVRLMKRLASYYDKQEFFKNRERNNEYFNKVRNIPGGEAIEQIFSAITDEYDYLPRNLPRAIKAAWKTFRSSNPDRFIRSNPEEGEPGCDNCIRGWITFRLQDRKTGFDYEYTGTCGHCNSVRRESAPVVTLEQIARAGGRIVDPARYGSSGKNVNISEMVEAVGETV